jgi:xylulokinase
MQIKSDILQLPYQSLSRSDLATLGSALIAGYSTGLFTDLRTTQSKFVKQHIKVNPNLERDKKYLKYIEIYRDLFDTLKDIYRRIGT